MSLFNDIQNKAFKLLENLQSSTEKEIVKQYSIAQKAIKDDIKTLYSKYAEDGKLSYSELQKYDRLTKISNQIDEEMRKATKPIKPLTIKAGNIAYNLGTFHQGYAIDMSLNMSGSWGLFNKDAVKESILRKRYLDVFLTKSRADQISRANKKITQALISGNYGIRELTKIIEKAMAEGANSAETIAQTETTAIFGRAQTAIYEEARNQGINLEEVWDSTPGAKDPRHDPQENGKKRQSDGKFHLSSGARCDSPGNCDSARDSIRCRCRIRAELIDYDLESTASQSYDEWSKKYNL